MVATQIDVEIQLPEGSRVSADVAMACVRGTGRLGKLDVKTDMGDVRVEEAASVRVRTGFGDVMVGRVEGDADVKTGSGRIDIGSVGGSATVKNSNGDTRIGDVEGRAQLQMQTARSKWTALAGMSRQRPLSGTSAWGGCRRAPLKPKPPTGRSTSEFSTASPPG